MRPSPTIRHSQPPRNHENLRLQVCHFFTWPSHPESSISPDLMLVENSLSKALGNHQSGFPYQRLNYHLKKMGVKEKKDQNCSITGYFPPAEH
jgi:hypothetical protein